MFDLHALIEKIKSDNGIKTSRQLVVFGNVSRLFINGQEIEFSVIEEMLDFISENGRLVRSVIIARLNGISVLVVNTKLKQE